MYYLLTFAPTTAIYDLVDALTTLEALQRVVSSYSSHQKYKVIHYDETTGKFTELDDI